MGRYLKIRPLLKFCNFCKRSESEVKFSGDRITKCNECVSKTRNVWYEKNKIEINRKKIEWRKRVSLIPEIIIPIKRGKGWSKFSIATHEVIRSPMVDEKYMEIEPTYCSTFSCGKKLTRTEKLFGNKCIEHQVFIRKIF